MKLTFTTLLLIAFCFSTNAQTSSVNIPFVAYWSKGDIYKFNVSKIKERASDGETTSDTTAYEATFEVLDSTDKSYRIKWSYKYDMSSMVNLPKETAYLIQQYKDIDVIYNTNEYGQFVGVENWEEIAGAMNAFFQDVFKRLLEDKTEEEKKSFNKTLTPIVQQFQTKEGVENYVVSELLFFHYLFGIEFVSDEVLSFEEEYPNLFGGKPLSGEAQIEVKSVDADKEHCVITYTGAVNPEDAKDMIWKVFKKMGLRGKEMKNALKDAKLDISDNHRFEFYYYPGVPIEIETKRTVYLKMEKTVVKRVDRTIIQLIED